MGKTKIHERIKELRGALGLSQTEFAYQAGISHSSLTKIEAGDNDVTQKVINKIKERWGVPSSWLVDGKGEMKFTSTESAVPWKDEAWTLAKQQLGKKDEQLDRLTTAFERMTAFLSRVEGSFLRPVSEAAPTMREAS